MFDELDAEIFAYHRPSADIPPRLNGFVLLNLAVENAVRIGFAFNLGEIKTSRARVIMFVSGFIKRPDVAVVKIIVLTQQHLRRRTTVTAVVTNNLRFNHAG